MNFLKIFLKISAIFQMFWWGFSHLFYPAWYHKIIGISGVDFRHGFIAAATNEIGILTLSIAFATWWASFDPIKNKVVIKLLYFAGIGSTVLFTYHIIVNDFSRGWLINALFIFLQLAVISVLYPWKTKT